MIAIWIGIRFTAESIFLSVLLATTVGVIASLLNDYLHFVDTTPARLYEGMEVVYTSIYDQKNVLGKAINLMSLALSIVGIKFKKQPLAIVLCVLLWIPLSRTKSVSSIFIYLITMTLPLLWWLNIHVKKLMILFLGLVVTFLTSIFLIFVLDLDIVNQLLLSVGKDSTLTGRTILWSVGIDAFVNHPLTGVGYQAFWHPGVFEEVRYILVAFQGLPLNGFHNVYIEVLVALGLFGFCTFIFLLMSVLLNSVNWYQKQRTAESFGVLFFVVSTLIAGMFDVIVFRQHEIFYILMTAFYVVSREHATYRELRP